MEKDGSEPLRVKTQAVENATEAPVMVLRIDDVATETDPLTEVVSNSFPPMRGFDDEERTEIREALVDAGEDFFLRVGPEKTTVRDLTEEVGIAKGSFYSFFDSKGALFLDVFRRLRDDLMEEVLAAVEDCADGRAAVEVLFHTYVEWLEAHPIIQKLTADVDAGRFRRSLPSEELAAAEREAVERLAPVVATWQEDGTVREDVPAEAVVGLLEPVALLAVTNDEYDAAYERQRDFAIETIARGLEPDRDGRGPPGGREGEWPPGRPGRGGRR